MDNLDFLGSGDANQILAHPSYEVNKDFMSLGFKLPVINNKKTEMHNCYIISRDGSITVTKNDFISLHESSVIFNTQDRVLLDLDDKWDRKDLVSFHKQPMKPEGLYYEIRKLLDTYIELQYPAQYGLISAWIIATYFHRCFHAFPFLYFPGIKQSGKSRILSLLERISFNAFKLRGITVPALGDTINSTRGTLIVDQAESLSDQKNLELVGLLADSYTPSGGKRRVISMENRVRRPLEFETYAPKVFASNKDIDTDLKDRCILFQMRKARKEYPYPAPHLPVWKEIRCKLYRLSLMCWKDATEIYQSTGEGVTQRARELWMPIETILRLEDVSENEIRSIMDVYQNSVLETEASFSDADHTLIHAINTLIGNTDEEVVLSIQQIIRHMGIKGIDLEDTFGIRGNHALSIHIGKHLNTLGLYLRKSKKRISQQRAYIFKKDHIMDLLSRYDENDGFNG